MFSNPRKTMIDKILKIKYLQILIFLFSFFLFSLNNQNISIYLLDEAKNASCAREIMETGNWDYPTFNYNLRADKPPLHYFFMILSYSVFGVNPWAARFFSAIFGALTILVVFRFTSRLANQRVALWSSIVLLASVHFQLQHHMAVPDPYLIFFMTWGMLLFISAYQTNNRLHSYLMYVALALGVLAKGPVAVLLPGLIFLVYLIIDKNLSVKTLLRLKIIPGAIIFMAIAVPWFVAAHFASDGEWTDRFFLGHNLNRFSSEMEGHGGIFLLTAGYVFIGMFPFSIYFVRAWKYFRMQKDRGLILFSVVVSVIIVLFFTLSKTKLPNYTVIAYPFLAIFLANSLNGAPFVIKRDKILLTALLVLLVILFIGGLIAMGFDPVLSKRRYLIMGLLVLPIGVWLTISSLKKAGSYARLILASTGILTGIIFFGLIYPQIDRLNPVNQSIHLLQGKDVAYYKRYNPGYAFKLKKRIDPLEAGEITTWFSKHPEGIIISTEKLIKEIEIPEGYDIIFSKKDIFETPVTVLIGPAGQ